MHDENSLDYAISLTAGCLLPELVNEIGDNYIEPQYFDVFRQALDEQLVQLFDFIQQHEYLIFKNESKTREIRRNFILLLCEQTAPGTLFQTKNPILLEHVHALVKRYFIKFFNDDSRLESTIFNYYKDKLKSDIWKKQLGATHGFVQFLNLGYNNNDIELPSDLCTFVLSVGLLFNEFYEPAYKELSFKIFNVLLKSAKNDHIRHLNIHNVVYNAISLDVAKVDRTEGTKLLWECLFKCVLLTRSLDFSKWNKLDDIIETAIRRITFAPNLDVRCILFLMVSKLCVIFSTNGEEIASLLEFDQLRLLLENVNGFRALCSNITSHASYKWAKKLLNLFVAESHSLIDSGKTSQPILWVMHVCFLVCILPISINILQPHMIEFLGKFIPVLMEVSQIHKDENGILKDVKSFLESFLYHMEKYQSKNKEIINYETALKKILQEDIFRF